MAIPATGAGDRDNWCSTDERTKVYFFTVVKNGIKAAWCRPDGPQDNLSSSPTQSPFSTSAAMAFKQLLAALAVAMSLQVTSGRRSAVRTACLETDAFL